MLAFVRDPNKPVHPLTIGKLVHSTMVTADVAGSLLGVMKGVFTPALQSKEQWPESIRKEFAGGIHRYMAQLTEQTHELRGQTKLYVPSEGYEGYDSPDAAAASKDLVQRLESVVIHWTRKIREVVDADAQSPDESLGPLAEIAFWRRRGEDMSGLRDQLRDPKLVATVSVLEAAKSAYVSAFLDLGDVVQKEAEAASDNAKFLSALEEPCEALAVAKASDVAALLPPILMTVRMIWNHASHYATPELTYGLLRKISAEVINRCGGDVAVQDILDGTNLGDCQQTLRDSIAAGEAWKASYVSTKSAVNRRAGDDESRRWDFREASLFAQIDAFVQRCKDLMEVCEAQEQFAGKSGVAPPVFAGTKGPEITRQMSDIERDFVELVESLRGLDYHLMDIKATSWHDDYNTFKEGVKTLDQRTIQVYTSALDAASGLEGKTETLEALNQMARRVGVKRHVEKQVVGLYGEFSKELVSVRKQFDSQRSDPPVHASMPRHAGGAMWAKQLHDRLSKPWSKLEVACKLFPRVAELDELKASFEQALPAIEKYIKTTHEQWSEYVEARIEPTIAQRLDARLLAAEEDGRISMNFDKELMSLFSEVGLWERLQKQAPYKCAELASQREKYRLLRQNVLQVVSDYNGILAMLDANERALFADRIRYLDKKIAPGLQKVSWTSSKSIQDMFMADAGKFCAEVNKAVTLYKDTMRKVRQNLALVAETPVIKIVRKKVYADGEFAAAQKSHREETVARFKELHEEMRVALGKCFARLFAQDSEDVQREWRRVTRSLDDDLRESLRVAVKKSLQQLARALNGDKRTEVVPMFSAANMLKDDKAVKLAPDTQGIFDMVHEVSRELIGVVKEVSRLGPEDTEDGEELPTFYDVISDDEDAALKQIIAIDSGLGKIVNPVATFVARWEASYRHVWETDKDQFIARYRKAKKPLADFEADIERYQALLEQVTREDGVANLLFLRIDSAPLKSSLKSHCEEWTRRFTTLLLETANEELADLYSHFESNTKELVTAPTNLDELAAKVDVHKRIMETKEETHGRFAPLRAVYASLHRMDVPAPAERIAELDALDDSWITFVNMLSKTAADLDEAKETFQEKLGRTVDKFVQDVVDHRDAFMAEAPKKIETPNARLSLDAAKAFLAAAAEKSAGFRAKEEELKAGMDIFAMSRPPLKELLETEKDTQLLNDLWAICEEWIGVYDGLKDGKFKDLDVEVMENMAVGIGKKLQKIGREVGEWTTWSSMKTVVDDFKKTMPLITDLRNPAIRQRHWDQLMQECGATFDPHGDDFTLGKVTEIGLHNHDEFIGEMSTNATKELAMEKTLEGIEETWRALDMDMVPFREGKEIYKLRSTEDVFAALEDNIVTLSTMKASKYFVVFETPINAWEQKLGLVSEVVEIVQKVQMSWMYLENIFVGSEDIRKQLPQESILFDSVNDSFAKYMLEMKTLQNVIKACTGSQPDPTPGVDNAMLERFTNMDEKLEKIQKSLENYLEKKRQQFPRFYFISSDDLLEILGQAKNPPNVQPHFKGMFEGIKKLEMTKPGTDGRKTFASTAMHSPDGETIPFNEPVITDGRPEEWLNDVEAAMYAACKKSLFETLTHSKGMKKEAWVREYPGQMIISAGCMVWTTECEKALSNPDTAKTAVRTLKKKWVSYLSKLVTLTRSKLDKVNRKKVVALITIEVHARDSIDKLAKAGCTAPTDFEWVSQLRFYWDQEQDDCVVKQVLSVFSYGYEYQGNNGRLVVTPLTDRCYMTLGAAMFTRRGGNPLGPAGTGKTETVKDFGKALARYVIVFNCSDGVDYKMTAKMFSGLAQTGAWACLDEFNRITVEVLSVVATQIGVIMAAVKARASTFFFEGQTIRLIPSCGVFVTMNPGYAGRAELPDNLKAIVRPVSMMVPDFSLIAEIMMFAEGFSSAKPLAKKMVAIMELSQQQLSKQDHYDYTLRSFVIPISRAAGAFKRVDPEGSEEAILYRTMQDLIMPKLVYLDLPLFRALLGDLFPGVELPEETESDLKSMLERKCREMGLQVVDDWITKIIQIFDCKVARHGNMIVGRTGAGKSAAWKVLKAAMEQLCEDGKGEGEFQKVEVYTINPLALSNDEIYGCFDPGTHEWRDGILARVMRNICKDESPNQKWTLFDGPVDTLWIESMNTLLDDNKLLTLLSGERIMMAPQVSILFEVEDLSQASPATVSRAGMIYLNTEDLGWWPFVTSWLEQPEYAEDKILVQTLTAMLEKYMEESLELRRLQLKELVDTDRLASVRQFCALFDAHHDAEHGIDPSLYPNLEDEPEGYVAIIELTFLFCLIWSVGASLDDDSRKKFDVFLRENDTRWPHDQTVYEYFVDAKAKEWVLWEKQLTTYRPPPEMPFFKIMVPTVDTLRSKTIALTLSGIGRHVLIVGNVGVGKTMVAQSCLDHLPENKSSMIINFSAQTSSNSLQNTIEGRLEKRSKGVFAPSGGKKMVVFVDDFNMPQKSVFGFMPPLELLKLWADNGFWYDREKQEVKTIKDIQLMASMAPPGGGRNAFSQRIMSVFSVLNMTNPSDLQLHRIYSTLLNDKLSQFDDSIKPLGDPITKATVELYFNIAEELLPTPAKSHYLFNTRDLAKVIQGTMQATRQYYDSRETMLQLWVHECFRIFGDRMWDMNDKAWLKKQLDQKLNQNLMSSWDALFGEADKFPFYGECPPFVSFLRNNVDNPPYEIVSDSKKLKDMLTEKLEDYAMEPGYSAMDLVLFKDALLHVCRIHRVLMQPRGNALLVGVGGSGRKSLARLATYVADLKCFSIEITRNYRQTEFREDLKSLFKQAGVADKPTVFLFDETQIVVETFLEDINNVLTSGEVPNLFTKDELGGVCEDVRASAKKDGVKADTQDQLYSYFLSRVIRNLHIVLCMSPIGEGFRERCRMFPGLVNCCTIDWFTEWPADALREVAMKQMEEEKSMSQEVKDNLCSVFALIHSSTAQKSAEMLAALKRKNYVTPTNYLEFVRGYRTLLLEKTKEIGGKRDKLRGGLTKLDETGVQVEEMSVIAEEKRVSVAQAKVDCEELLVVIVQDKRAADEQERLVKTDAEKIGEEAKEANAIAAECERGLAQAMPALEAASAALNVLTKKDMSEMKAYAKPPAMVELCLQGVMTVLKKTPTWEQAKKELGKPDFLNTLMNYDKDKHLNDELLKKIKKFVDNPDYEPENIGKVSGAAKGLCQWVHAMYVYGGVNKEVAPKKRKLENAQKALEKKQKALAAAEEKLQAVLDKVKALQDKYEESTGNKKALEDEFEDLSQKLARAETLVSGLAGEKIRWEESIVKYEAEIACLPGDVVIAAAFMSYAGPFPSDYREALVKNTWLPEVKKLEIPASDEFDFALFLADPSDVRDWNINELPADQFSTENGVVVTRGRRWPLLIDPQGQGNKWIKNTEKPNGLVTVTLNMSDMVRKMENAIQFGDPVLIQDVGEEIDPILEPVLSKSFIKKGNSLCIKLGDKEVDYSPDFRLYLTSKLSNPHYTPEVSTKVTIVNFVVKEQGLEDQLLNVVVEKERFDLHEQSVTLVRKVAEGKRTILELEDTLLDLLSNADGSLLDNIELINTLNNSKITSDEVTESLKIAEATGIEIAEASALYRPVSIRAAILYFVLYDLATIDPMYQFSLDAYKDLFLLSIEKAPKSEVLEERIEHLNSYHTFAVYKYTSRGLFEAHKLLLSLQMCVRILQSDNQVDINEWQFFLRGGMVLDRSDQPPNPAPDWISELAWDNVVELEQQVPHFIGITKSFEDNPDQWEDWYRNAEPENPRAAALPGEWEPKCNELQRMLLVRSLRMDRVEKAATTYVANSLGRKYVEPPVLDLNECYGDSTPFAPLIFVLSPGVDPTANLAQLAAQKVGADRLHSVALGQGQAPVATKLIAEACVEGNWVFLANCHLMLSWLPELQKIIERFEDEQPHENFRLWLSSNPTPHFPLAILQRGLKMTTEPPKGLRANLSRLYQTCVTQASFDECRSQKKYGKLLFALTYFHAVMLERRKFRTLGINIPYDFNDTDYSVSDDVLKAYLDAYVETPWDALKYLISEANYGGRVTDEIDRRVLAGYLNQFFCEDALNVPQYPLSSLEEYYIPTESGLDVYRDYIQTLPQQDKPEAFGQHPNADISYMITDSTITLESCLALQPKTGGTGAGGVKIEDTVLGIIDDMLSQTPQPFNHEKLMKDKADDPSPLHVTLFQEVERYNILLNNMLSTLNMLKKGIKGLVVMSSDLDSIFESLANNKVPAIYLKAYPSLRPLGSWTRDLLMRLEQIEGWIENGYPRVYWLAGFTYPSCFLTAVLQTTARKNAIPIDTLSFEYSIMDAPEEKIGPQPKEGVYIKDMYLEGAGWNFDDQCLCEPNPMELIVNMPIVHFKPSDAKKKRNPAEIYQCPLYMYPVRTGSRERPSFMVFVDLKAGDGDSDFWVKRGTALLLALAT